MGASETWQRRNAWLIFVAVVLLACIAGRVAVRSGQLAEEQACAKVGGTLVDDGKGHRNCVPNLGIPVDPTGSRD